MFLMRDANCPLNCFPELPSPPSSTLQRSRNKEHTGQSLKNLNDSRDSSLKAGGFIIYIYYQLRRYYQVLLVPHCTCLWLHIHSSWSWDNQLA